MRILKNNSNNSKIIRNFAPISVTISMRKVVFILLTILLSATYVAKADNNDFTKHWTPITGTQYHMSVYGIITINGEEQFSDALEIGAFCGDECRGSSMAQLFPPTSQYVVPLSVVSNQESGETIRFRIYDHSINEELELTCLTAVLYQDNNDLGTVGNWFNFAFSNLTHYWTPITGTQYNMTVSGIIVINGVEQFTPYLEVGAFCGDECRGSEFAQYFPLTGQYVVPMTIVSNQESGETITFRLYDHELAEELVELHCTNPVTFVNDAVIGNPMEWFQFAFSNMFMVTVTIEPEGAGTVEGAGEYAWGSTATLTASDNVGFVFKEWEVGGEIVSTERTYSFDVYADVNLIARYYYQQINNLVNGWNWWSTYIEQNNNDGLTMLENSLGHNGVVIKSQTQSVINYYPQTEDDMWFGDLTALNNENSYLIQTNAACEIAVTGDIAVAANHPITLTPNWTWIGYPMTAPLTIQTAMSQLEPAANDVLKSQAQSIIYYSGYGWWPNNYTFTPGCGYKYFSNATENKTFVYTATGSKDGGMTEVENRFWNNDAHAFAENMSVLVMAYVDNEAMQNDNIEVGAFVNGENRGSAHLTYFPPLNRYCALITVAGQKGDKVEFGLVDAENNKMSLECSDNVMFEADAMIGSLDKPFETHFAEMKDINKENIFVYPNPMDRNSTFSVEVPYGETITEIVVTNTLGKTMHKEHLTPGTYIIKVSCQSGSVYYGKLIVK